jgi:hypothetical protein
MMVNFVPPTSLSGGKSGIAAQKALAPGVCAIGQLVTPAKRR